MGHYICKKSVTLVTDPELQQLLLDHQFVAPTMYENNVAKQKVAQTNEREQHGYVPRPSPTPTGNLSSTVSPMLCDGTAPV